MTTDVSSWRTSKQTKRTTGCQPCLPDLETTRPENLPPKEKVIDSSTDAEKANKRSDRASINLRSIQLVFSCLFYRSSTLTSGSSTVCTLVFPIKKKTPKTKKQQTNKQNKTKPHTFIKRRMRVLKSAEISLLYNLGLARALTILVVSGVSRVTVVLFLLFCCCCCCLFCFVFLSFLRQLM